MFCDFLSCRIGVAEADGGKFKGGCRVRGRMRKVKARGTLPPADSLASMVFSWGVRIEGVPRAGKCD